MPVVLILELFLLFCCVFQNAPVMITRQSITNKLLNLKEWQFLGYVSFTSDGFYIARLRPIQPFIASLFHNGIPFDYKVKESVNGLLMIADRDSDEWYVIR